MCVSIFMILLFNLICANVIGSPFLESEQMSPALEFAKVPSPVITTPGSKASFCARVRTNSNKKPQVSWEVAGKTVATSDKYIVSK